MACQLVKQGHAFMDYFTFTLILFLCMRNTQSNQEPGQLSGIALGYRLNDWECESQQGVGVFLFTTMSRLALGPTQPPI
jgi:hypothetical protein